MGYDMSTVETPTTTPSGYWPQIDDDPGYFRLNIWGMGMMYDVMGVAGVLDFEARHPKWPKWPPKGMSEERAEQLESIRFENEDADAPTTPPTRAEMEQIEAHRQAETEVRSKRSRKRGKVPGFKFGSNDGWIVTPEECLLIAEAVREVLACGAEWDPKSVLLLILRWAAYNELAAEHGGYKVW